MGHRQRQRHWRALLSSGEYVSRLNGSSGRVAVSRGSLDEKGELGREGSLVVTP